MIIAFLSGKGGTGKTLVSVNLSSLSKNGTYMDCDVEEPNGHLFFRPVVQNQIPVAKKIPVFSQDDCIGCRKCVDFCKFNALAFIKGKVHIETSLCHGCGGCKIICEHHAVSEIDLEIGHIDIGVSQNVKVMSGWMNVGEEAATPIIEHMFEIIDKNELVFADCPPGASCSVMACVRNADYVVVVAEATLYGKANLELIIQLIHEFKKPFGIILNQSSKTDNPVKTYCKEQELTILGEIEYELELAQISSLGHIAVLEQGNYRSKFKKILRNVLKEATS